MIKIITTNGVVYTTRAAQESYRENLIKSTIPINPNNGSLEFFLNLELQHGKDYIEKKTGIRPTRPGMIMGEFSLDSKDYSIMNGYAFNEGKELINLQKYINHIGKEHDLVISTVHNPGGNHLTGPCMVLYPIGMFKQHALTIASLFGNSNSEILALYNPSKDK